MTKICTKCDGVFQATAENFPKRNDAKDKLMAQCRTCYNAKRKKYMATSGKARAAKKAYRKRTYNAEDAEVSRHRSKLKYNYGITLEQYDKMFEAQGGVCDTCGGINKNGYRLSVDHNHETGKVRGLLCQECNSILGYAKENTETLLACALYLEKHKQIHPGD